MPSLYKAAHMQYLKWMYQHGDDTSERLCPQRQGLHVKAVHKMIKWAMCIDR